MSDKEYNPLVSVTVITYNSSKYVLETLESVKNQTYRNIELVISDDCSTDKTVDICKKWLAQNKERFVATQLITSPVNTGIPANKNRSIRECKGDWIKSIAGDDLLYAECIEKNILFANANDYYAIFSKAQVFKEQYGTANFLFTKPQKVENKFYNRLISSEEQYRIMLNFNPIPAPTVFIKKKLLLDIGLCDLRYPFVEDYPLYLKVVKGGYKFGFIPEVTVFYRVHSGTLSNSKVNLNFLESTKAFLINDIFSNCNFIRKASIIWHSVFYHLLVGFKNFPFFFKAIYKIKNRLDPNLLNIIFMKFKKLI